MHAIAVLQRHDDFVGARLEWLEGQQGAASAARSAVIEICARPRVTDLRAVQERDKVVVPPRAQITVGIDVHRHRHARDEVLRLLWVVQTGVL